MHGVPAPPDLQKPLDDRAGHAHKYYPTKSLKSQRPGYGPMGDEALFAQHEIEGRGNPRDETEGGGPVSSQHAPIVAKTRIVVAISGFSSHSVS